MALSAGTRLDPYEILAPIGAGSMGEVYKARDTRLERTVAVKVLPPQAADNAEARQRFEREARAVSSLNHPHICTLYDVGCQDGIDYLVMEHLEGESLSTRLATGPLPVDQALRYAVQIAEALADAHRHGVFHRDLKPGNVILTKAGAKLLDFGLAKMREGVPGPAGVTVGPTKDLTQAGSILGTVQYMAPEQLEGKDADARSDLFAFGAVLYEMLTGRKAFSGNSAASLITAIMSATPLPVSSIQPVTPALDRIVQKCLVKDPDQRWQTAQDLASELKWLAEGGAPVAPATGAALPSSSSRLWIAATAIAVLVAAVVSFLHFREPPPRQQTLRYQIPAPEKETIQDFALSPDGQRLAFTTGAGPQRLWVRSLDSLSAQPLPGTEVPSRPFWSPDSRAIAFFAGGKLKRVDLLGGPPQTLCDAPGSLPVWGSGAWSSAGVILFTRAPGTIYQVSAASGEARAVTTLDTSRQEIRHTGLQFLPDGRHFLYTAVSSTPENSALYAASLDSKETRRLANTSLNTAYTQDASGQGYLLFLRAATLLAQRFNAARLDFEGEPFLVADAVAALRDIDNTPVRARFSASDGGILSYMRGGAAAAKELVWFNRSGQHLSTVGELADYSNPALSPDEKRLVIARSQAVSRDVWIFELDRGLSTRFTFDSGDESNPIWSPDGRRIAFTSNRKGPRDIYVKDADGTGEDQVLFQSDEQKATQDWSGDGRYILFSGVALPLEGERKPVALVKGGDTTRVSPDGRWLAYRSTESGRPEICVQSFPGLLAGRPTAKWQVSTAGGTYPEWRRDGQELFYIAPGNQLMAVDVKASGTKFETGIPKPLFPLRIEALSRRTHYQPAANGQRFLVVQLLERESSSSPIDVVVNWAAGIKR